MDSGALGFPNRGVPVRKTSGQGGTASSHSRSRVLPAPGLRAAGLPAAEGSRVSTGTGALRDRGVPGTGTPGPDRSRPATPPGRRASAPEDSRTEAVRAGALPGQGSRSECYRAEVPLGTGTPTPRRPRTDAPGRRAHPGPRPTGHARTTAHPEHSTSGPEGSRPRCAYVEVTRAEGAAAARYSRPGRYRAGPPGRCGNPGTAGLPGPGHSRSGAWAQSVAHRATAGPVCDVPLARLRPAAAVTARPVHAAGGRARGVVAAAKCRRSGGRPAAGAFESAPGRRLCPQVSGSTSVHTLGTGELSRRRPQRHRSRRTPGRSEGWGNVYAGTPQAVDDGGLVNRRPPLSTGRPQDEAGCPQLLHTPVHCSTTRRALSPVRVKAVTRSCWIGLLRTWVKLGTELCRSTPRLCTGCAQSSGVHRTAVFVHRRAHRPGGQNSRADLRERGYPRNPQHLLLRPQR